MKRNLLCGLCITLFLFSFIASAEAQSPYSIKGQVHGLSDTTVYLANYYGNKLYYNDTTYCDKAGRFEFEGKPFDEQGKYALVIPGPKYFDFLVGSENVQFETDTTDLVGNLKFHKSIENQVFYEYIRFINDMRRKRQPLDIVLGDSTLTDEMKKPALDDVKAMNEKVVAYQKDLVTQNPDLLVGKFVKMSMELEIPDAPDDAEDEKVWQYKWYLNNYWTMSDLDDNRMVRDQAFHNMLDKYINKVLPQIPDTIAVETIKLAEKVKAKPDLFKYIVHFVTYNSLTSKLMCMDKVFVGLVDEYYRTGQATWLDDEKLKEIIDDADNRARVMCDAKIPNVILPDTSDTKWVSLYDVKAKYTVVAIWESTCGHCKKELPKLQKVYDEWHDRGLEIYSIGNDYEREPWKKFIREKELGDWIHVSDDPAVGNDNPDTVRYLLSRGITTIESLNFRKTFNISSTPVLFLLDEDKNIIAKQLNSHQISDLLDHLESKNAGEAKIMQIKDPDDEDEVEVEKENPVKSETTGSKADQKSEDQGKKKPKKRAKSEKS